MFPAEVPKRLPDNEDTRELPKPFAVPIYSLCRKTQWGSVALNIKLIERTTKRLYVWLHWILRHTFALNYALCQVTQLQHKASFFFNVSDTSGCFYLLLWCSIICFITAYPEEWPMGSLCIPTEMSRITVQSYYITHYITLLHNERWGAFICHVGLLTSLMNRKLAQDPITHIKTPGAMYL